MVFGVAQAATGVVGGSDCDHRKNASAVCDREAWPCKRVGSSGAYTLAMLVPKLTPSVAAGRKIVVRVG